MNYRIEVSHQYLKDLKLARKRNLDESKLNDIILKLAAGQALPANNHDHALVGDYRGYRECHINPDWLLIYKRDDVLLILSLLRTGTHSDLF